MDEPRRGPLTAADFHALLSFRTALRHFQRWSEAHVEAVGLTPAQHQLLLAVKGHPDDRGPTIRDVAGYLLTRHHSAVELVNRVEAAGYLERRVDSSDARAVRLRLTATGEDRILELTELHLQELETLAPMLRPIVDMLGHDGVPAASEGPAG